MISKRFLASAAAAAIVFGACGSTGSPTPSASSAATSPPASTGASSPPASSSAPSPSGVAAALFGSTYKPGPGTPGGTLVVGEWQAPDTLNPFTTTAFTSFEALSPISRGFITIDSQGKYLPDLAASIPTQDNGGVTINPDGKTFDVKVTLKPNLKWSDGQPLTMNDFAYTVKLAQTTPGIPGCVSCNVGFPDISGVDVSTDGLTATIHYKDLYAGWLGFLTTAILPQHYFQNLSVADFAKSMPVGDASTKVPWNGPFMISAASKSEIDYVPNPNWAGGVGGQHAPYLAGLKFKFYGTKDGMIADFLAGNLDLALDMTQADYPALSKVAPAVGTAELTPAWQYEHLDLFNDPLHTRGNGLWDPNVRKAIAMSINKDDLTAKVFPGQTISPQACSPAPPGLWYRDDSVQCPKYDPAGAMQLLTTFGMTGGTASCDPASGTGCFQYNGKTVKLELCTTSGNATRLTELQLVQGYLAKAGLDSYIKTGDAGSVVFAGWADTKPDTDCSIYRGNYDLADFAYILGADIYNNYYFTYNSSQFPEIPPNQGSNDTRFSSPDMDAATNAVKTEVDLSKQLDFAKTIQAAYVAGTPEIPLYYRNETTGVGVHMGNWPKYNPSSIGPLWDVEDWFFKQ